MPILPPGLQSTSINSTSTTPSIDNSKTNGSNSNNNHMINEIDKYGLKGLSSLAKMEQNDQTKFAIGQDVNLLGFDLSPLEKKFSLLKNLSSPWIETSRSDVEPYFSLPAEIQNENIEPKPENCDNKIQSFSDETLFYIFYMKPRDTLQEYASRELVTRNWRYHKDIQVWLTKDSNIEPILISPDVEKGVYIFFDPHNWEKIKKEFVLHYSSVQA